MATWAPGKLEIRRGNSRDLAQVRQFTQDTFRWGDYLAGAWESWVHSKRGILFVAEMDGMVVGTAHVRLLEHREAWLEGIRVRHEFRQHGIATALIQVAHSSARAEKCNVIRLETGSHNLRAQRAFEKSGYQRLSSFSVYKASAVASQAASPHPPKRPAIDLCWDLWQHSAVRSLTRGVVPAPYGWRWWELTRRRIADQARGKWLLYENGAFALSRTQDDGLDITLLAGTKRPAVKLLHTARRRAFQLGKPYVYWIAPDAVRTAEWAALASYTLDDDGLLIYACRL